MQGLYVEIASRFEVLGPGVPEGDFAVTEVEPVVKTQLDKFSSSPVARRRGSTNSAALHIGRESPRHLSGRLFRALPPCGHAVARVRTARPLVTETSNRRRAWQKPGRPGSWMEMATNLED